jgi:hypothetical protein
MKKLAVFPAAEDTDDDCTCDSVDYATAINCPVHGLARDNALNEENK